MIKSRMPFFIIALLSAVLFFLMSILLLEYNALLDQHYQLELVKREYRQHMWHMKQLRDIYALTAQRVQYLESLTEQIKDRSQEGTMHNIQLPRLGLLDVVTADGELQLCDEFIPLNRDLEYLKQSTYEYLKKYNRELLLRSYTHDMWRDYTHAVLSSQKPEVKQKKQLKKSIKSNVKRTAPSIQKRSHIRTREAIFSWPIDRACFWLSSGFGKRTVKGVSRFHYGIDMAALKGTPVKAAASGIVIEARNARGFGNTIVIQHNKKYKTRYAHLDRIHVRTGQKVQRGQRIGDVGDTGLVHATGVDASHLHFEVSLFGERVNPQYYLM